MIPTNGRETNTVLQYMKLGGEQKFETENYVSTPPALLVVEGDGTVWTLGFNRTFGPRGEFAFDVLRNGSFTGEWASRIERRSGRVRVFTVEGWKVWSGSSFI
jgi:hypothetical protein